jgi:hypothetical protein
MGHFVWERRKLVTCQHAFLKTMASSNAGRQRGDLIVGQNQPAHFAWEGIGWDRSHVIVFESYHLERPALCKLNRESGEVAVGKEGNLKFMETIDLFWE